MRRSTAPKRPSQERGKKTRESIVSAATKSLLEHHLYGLRFSQIAKQAKVPQPLMDYHFPSLESLLNEMVLQQLEKLRLVSVEAIEAHAVKPRKALEAYIRAPFDLAEADAGFRAVWTAYYHLTTILGSFAEFNNNVRRTGHERFKSLLVSYLQHEKKAKYLNRPKLIDDMATHLQSLVTGYVIMGMTDRTSNFKSLADLAAKAAAQLLNANFP